MSRKPSVCKSLSRKGPLLLLLCIAHISAQEKASAPALDQILQRLNAVEKENLQLLQEIRSLRQEIEASQSQDTSRNTAGQTEQPTIQERVTVNENRISEQAQTKVESSQKFPLQLDGMLLFNAFANSANGSSSEYGILAGPERSGATVRQTLLGLKFEGPRLPGDGRLNGSLMMDFWAGYAEPGTSWMRLRRADISLDWTNRSFSVGQDKPLIAPYQPSSLAEVGVPPLAGAGNLWLWLPQARYEERRRLGSRAGLTGQLELIQTDEKYNSVPVEYSRSLSMARPGVEGRVAFWRQYHESGKFEVGSGFHASTSHVAGASVPSRIASIDWLFDTGSHFSITGTFYHGKNIAGLGALNNGFAITDEGAVVPVHSSGGWTQVSVPITSRLTWNLFAGLEDDRGVYLPAATAHSLSYASNFMYHLGPNVVVSLEGLQLRTRSVLGIEGLHNHYDLAIGYLF